MKINVLDHGFVRLVSYIQPAQERHLSDGSAIANSLEESMVTKSEEDYVHEVYGKIENPGWTGDLEVVRNARVSYKADWRTGDDEGKDKKLIKRMVTHGHSSPFEAMVFTFEVKAPIFVFRQWQRHRTWSYNEVSARYTELDEGFYVPDPKMIGVQAPANKQVRDITGVETELAKIAAQIIKDHCEASFSHYRGLLGAGVPRELARSILPVAAYSRMFATVDLHNLFHFLTLRLHSHAQYEIRVYAEALLELIRPIVPVSVTEFEEKRDAS